MPSTDDSTASPPVAALERRWLLPALVVSSAIVHVAAVRGGGPSPLGAFVSNPFASVALAGIFVHYLVATTERISRERVIQATPVVLVAPLVALAAGGGAVAPARLFLFALAGLGVVGAAGYVYDVVRAEGALVRSRRLDDFAAALMLPLAAAQAPWGLWTTYDLNPVYDAHVYAFEERLGLRFSLVGVQSYRFWPLSGVATACYAALPIGLSLLALKQPTSRRRSRVLVSAVVTGVVGFTLYRVCPVVGPLQAYPDVYPARLPELAPRDIAPLVVALAAPRNGMPSLHAAWALIVAFNMHGLPRAWIVSGWIFVAMTLWAAMGLTDTHWLTDLVVAVPFSVALQSAIVGSWSGPRVRYRLTVFLLCAIWTGLWLAALRTGDIARLPGWVAWLAFVSTVLVPLVLERRLEPR
jgi:hypothetical protein